MKLFFLSILFSFCGTAVFAGPTTNGFENLVWCDSCHKYVPGKPFERSHKSADVSQTTSVRNPAVKAAMGAGNSVDHK